MRRYLLICCNHVHIMLPHHLGGMERYLLIYHESGPTWLCMLGASVMLYGAKIVTVCAYSTYISWLFNVYTWYIEGVVTLLLCCMCGWMVLAVVVQCIISSSGHHFLNIPSSMLLLPCVLISSDTCFSCLSVAFCCGLQVRLCLFIGCALACCHCLYCFIYATHVCD